jgi:hypothetical protein
VELAGFHLKHLLDRWSGAPFVSQTDRASRDVLILEYEGRVPFVKVTVRPSGTEPKTKVYFEVADHPLGLCATDKELNENKQLIEAMAREIEKDMVQHCYAVIGVDMPDRSLSLSQLLPVELKEEYFRVEEQLLSLGPLLEAGGTSKDSAVKTAQEKLSVFGPDPIAKITDAFRERTGLTLEAFLGLPM